MLSTNSIQGTISKKKKKKMEFERTPDWTPEEHFKESLLCPVLRTVLLPIFSLVYGTEEHGSTIVYS